MAFFSESLALPGNAFIILRDLIKERTGIYFDENKKDMLADKLSDRVLQRGFNSFMDYYYLLKYDSSASDEWTAVLDLITVQETYFWREYDQINTLLNVVLPEVLNSNEGSTIRIWCAACSSGEEPLSILMALDSAGWLSKTEFDILATDVSSKAINTAREGLYRERSFRQIPGEKRTRYFTKEGNLWRIQPDIHSMIKWKIINLSDDFERSLVPVQNIIFCRNVFIYFRDDTIKRITDGFWSQLTSPGYLFVGVTESLFRIKSRFELTEMAKTFVYRKT